MMEIYSYTMLFSIISFAVATAFTPGPNNLMLLSSGLTFGYKRTLGHILGIVFGFPLMVMVVGLGVAKILEQFPIIYTVLKVIGILYLLWMAWHIAHNTGRVSTSQSTDKPFTFMQAALFQWVNPKAWIMAVTATSTFTTEGEHFFTQVIIITLLYLLVGVFSTHTWTLGGVILHQWLESERAIQSFNRIMALLIITSVVPFILDV